MMKAKLSALLAAALRQTGTAVQTNTAVLVPALLVLLPRLQLQCTSVLGLVLVLLVLLAKLQLQYINSRYCCPDYYCAPTAAQCAFITPKDLYV